MKIKTISKDDATVLAVILMTGWFFVRALYAWVTIQ